MKGETFCMHLYLLRHGIAVEAQAGESDAARALTSDGRRKLRKVLKAVAEAKVKPTLMWSSELKRAIQTAEVAKAVLGYQGEILRTKALAPGADTEQVWEEIRVHRDEASLMLVGHNPQFDQLAPYLLGASHLAVDFKKGAIMRIDIEGFGARPRGTLCWYLTAKLSSSRE
jgi:phosphohistidine phosphatase